MLLSETERPHCSRRSWSGAVSISWKDSLEGISVDLPVRSGGSR